MTCVVVLLVTIRKKQLNRRLEIVQRNNTLELNSYQQCTKDIEVSENDFRKQLGDTPFYDLANEPIYESLDDLTSQQNESEYDISSEDPEKSEDSDYVSMKGFRISGVSPISH